MAGPIAWRRMASTAGWGACTCGAGRWGGAGTRPQAACARTRDARLAPGADGGDRAGAGEGRRLRGGEGRLMRIRIAAIGVSHWHSLYDSAYLRHAVGMPDVELVGLHDPSAEIAAKRAAALGGPPVFTDYREM